MISTDGDICTAYDGTSCTTTTASAKLIINGSLISLKATAGLKLVRQLDDNTEPAELINYQPPLPSPLFSALQGALFAAFFPREASAFPALPFPFPAS